MPPRFSQAVLVLAAGSPPDPRLARSLASRAAAILCADGAYRTALGLGLIPRWVVGDMDSLGPGALGRATTFVVDEDPNRSDLEKSLAFLASHGCPEAWVLGAIGGRLDHTLSNLQVLERWSDKIRLALFEGRQVARVFAGEARFEATPGEVVSLFPAGTERATVSLSGLRYPLNDEELPPGSRGVSNVVVSRRVSVAVRSGKVWLVRGPKEK